MPGTFVTDLMDRVSRVISVSLVQTVKHPVQATAKVQNVIKRRVDAGNVSMGGMVIRATQNVLLTVTGRGVPRTLGIVWGVILDTRGQSANVGVGVQLLMLVGKMKGTVYFHVIIRLLSYVTWVIFCNCHIQ